MTKTSKDKVEKTANKKRVHVNKASGKDILKSFGYSPKSSGYASVLKKHRMSGSELRHLVACNGDIQSCIDKIIDSTALNGLILKDKEYKTVDRADAPEVYAYLDNLFIDGIDTNGGDFDLFVETIVTDMFISGEVVLEPIYLTNEKITRFRAFPPDKIKKVEDTQGNLTGFKQKIGKGKTQEFNLEDIYLGLYKRSLINRNNGQSKIESIFKEACLDAMAQDTSLTFFENKMTPGAYVMLRDEDYDDEELRELVARLEKFHSGAGQSNNFVMSNAIEDIKPLTFSYKDLEFMSMRYFIVDKICSRFCMNKELIGYNNTNGSFSKSDSTWKQFYKNTIAPIERKIEKFLNGAVQKYAAQLEVPGLADYYICCNATSLYDAEEQRQDVKCGLITINEARRDRGLTSYEDERFDQPVLESNLQSIDDVFNTQPEE